MPSFYEFFAGGGMARAGLANEWTCLLANDIDEKKGASYAANWGDEHLAVRDVAELTIADLPGRADLAWASFPCQDLSLAGNGAAGRRTVGNVLALLALDGIAGRSGPSACAGCP